MKCRNALLKTWKTLHLEDNIRDSDEPSSTSESTQGFYVNELDKSLFELELEVKLKMPGFTMKGSDANNSGNTIFEEVNH